MMNQVIDRLQEQNIHLTVDDEVIAYLSREGFDPTYGARPLRRAIQRMVEDSLSEEVLSGRIHLGDTVHASLQDEKIVYTKAESN